MDKTTQDSLKKEILYHMAGFKKPVVITKLVDKICKKYNAKYSPTDVKINTLNLVSEGLIILDENWRIQIKR